ncbi:hypothetical protein M758_1G108100 [Ceratodon purpureus]|nr:hypothetical protein M758_1G108100 [Ceratodon purpureus]
MAKEDYEDEGPNEGGEGDEEHGGVTERLRQRTKRKPVYVEEDESMEDEEWEAPDEEEEEEEDDEEEEKDVRKGEQHDDFCDVCNTGGIMADPLGDVEKILDMQMRPIKVPGKASDHGADKAPDQAADEQAEDKASVQAEDDDYYEAGDEASDPAPDKRLKGATTEVKQYLIKWKSKSFLH